MTLNQAKQQFISTNKTAFFQVWKKDNMQLREAWNTFVFLLYQHDKISQRQHDNWTINGFYKV